MEDTNGARLLVACYVIAVSINIWQDIKAGNKPPRPQPIAGTGLAFALLALASPMISEKLAGTLAIGLLLGLVYLHLGTTANASPAITGGTPSGHILVNAPQTPAATSAGPYQID